MKREEYRILSILTKKNNCTPATGSTAREIRSFCEELGIPVSKTTLYKNLKDCMAAGWIGEGFRSGKARTYYVTLCGKESANDLILKDLKGGKK